MTGLSGFDHRVDAVGLRNDNLALIFSGPRDIGLRSSDAGGHDSPRFKSEVWCRDALFRMYDISGVLEREGLKVDLVLFENRLTGGLPDLTALRDIKAWAEQNNLPSDWRGSWQFAGNRIDVPGARYLSDAARGAGACYFGLNDLTPPEIAAMCGDDESHAEVVSQEAMSRVRVTQYFNPPTDELILTALALSRRHDPQFPEDIYRAAVSLAHTPAPNTVVPSTDYTDPVATAKELSKCGAIGYSGEIRLEKDGREIVHRVEKTAQENFVIRALRTLDIPGIVKALVDGFKSGS